MGNLVRIGGWRLGVYLFFVATSSIIADGGGERQKVANIRDFGAVGDGKADDSAAIQKAVDAKADAVNIPRGRFRITKTITIDLDSVGPTAIVGRAGATVIMAGPGPAFKLIGTHQGSAAPKDFKENVWLNQRMPTVDHLEIIGDHPEAVAIESVGVMQPTFTRLLVRHALHAIHLTTRNRNVIITECHFYQNRGIGVFLDRVNLHQINISNCHISYNQGGGVVVKYGDVRNLHIVGCDIEANHAPQGDPAANILVDTTEGTIGEVAVVGCTVQHTNVGPETANIRMIGRIMVPGPNNVPKEPRARQSIQNVTIANNIFSDIDYGIQLKSVRGATITGNTLWSSTIRDLLVEECEGITVTGNTCDMNPHYRDFAGTAGGVTFRDCKDCTITGLQISHSSNGPAALIIERCQRFNIDGCTILDSVGPGILLKDVDHSRLSDCLIRDDRPDASDPVAIEWKGGKGNLVAEILTNGRLEIETGAAKVAVPSNATP